MGKERIEEETKDIEFKSYSLEFFQSNGLKYDPKNDYNGNLFLTSEKIVFENQEELYSFIYKTFKLEYLTRYSCDEIYFILFPVLIRSEVIELKSWPQEAELIHKKFSLVFKLYYDWNRGNKRHKNLFYDTTPLEMELIDYFFGGDAYLKYPFIDRLRIEKFDEYNKYENFDDFWNSKYNQDNLQVYYDGFASQYEEEE